MLEGFDQSCIEIRAGGGLLWLALLPVLLLHDSWPLYVCRTCVQSVLALPVLTKVLGHHLDASTNFF